MTSVTTQQEGIIMDENIVPTEETLPNTKPRFTRKLLVLGGATAGLLLAGGIALLNAGRKTDDCGCPVTDEEPPSED